MVDDIRLQLSFKNHRKRRKLNALLSLQPSGTDYLLDLWLSTAQNHPEGKLKGMDELDIALEAGWNGDPKQFVEALMETRLLEQNGECFELCEWGTLCIPPKWPTSGHRPFSKTWQKLKRMVFNRDEFICKYCGLLTEKPECDHIIPICRGGSNQLNNLATACLPCNRSKGTKLVKEWQDHHAKT